MNHSYFLESDMSLMEAPERNLAFDLVRVTEAAALASARWLGRGDKNAGDLSLIHISHDPDFSGHGRARTPRDHDGRQDGTKLPDERQRNSGPQKTHRAKLHQDIISLQAKDHSRKQRNQANDEQRFRADHIQLLKDLDEQLRSYEYLPQSLQQE